MKRIVALLLSALLVVGGASAFGEVLSLEGNAAQLQTHQSELNAVWSSIVEGTETGIACTGRHADVKAMIDGTDITAGGNAAQVEQNGSTIVISGGLHFIEASEAISTIVLKNDAVLINFRATVGTLSVEGTAEYYGLEGSYTQQLTVESEGHVYLFGAYGDRVTAGGRGEVNFFNRAYIQEVYLSDRATAAVLGEAVISGGYIKDNSLFYDPNARVASINKEGNATIQNTPAGGTVAETQPAEAVAEAEPTEEAKGVAADTPATKTSGSGSKSSGKATTTTRVSPNGVPYPDNIVEWVFNSKPQPGPVDYAGGCGCCDCDWCSGSCCKDCTCFVIETIKP